MSHKKLNAKELKFCFIMKRQQRLSKWIFVREEVELALIFEIFAECFKDCWRL